MWELWLIVSGVCLVIEIITTGFLVFWLAIGALFALLTSLFTDNIIIQIAVFVISSGMLIFLTKPFVKKFLNNSKPVLTNAYSVIGKHGLVIEDINQTLGTGLIKVDGEVWSAKCEKDKIISKGSEVEILALDGVKAVVSSNIYEQEKVQN